MSRPEARQARVLVFGVQANNLTSGTDQRNYYRQKGNRECAVNAHEYQNGRTRHGVSYLLMQLPCSSEVRGNGLLRLYYGGEGKHSEEAVDQRGTWLRWHNGSDVGSTPGFRYAAASPLVDVRQRVIGT